MDQLAQGAFVEAVAISSVEASCTGAAERALAGEVERKSILEWSLALRAEIFRGMSQGAVQTFGTDGDSRVSVEGVIADAALVREDSRKKSVGNLQ
jgi:hypothetical protein